MQLKVVGLEGKDQTESVDPTYLLPEELVGASKVVDLDHFFRISHL